MNTAWVLFGAAAETGMNTLILGALIAIYMIVISYLGFRGFRKTRDKQDYLLAGRSAHPFVMAMSYGAAFISTSALVGFGGIAVDTFSTVIVILIVAVLGLLSHFFVAKMMISISEQLINKIPFMGKVYKTVKQIVDTFSKQNKAVFQKAVLVEYPRKGCYSVGFLTSEATGEVAPLKDEKMYNVFVPTTPNPTGGFLLILPESEIRILKMSVGEAMKFIISGGAVNPELTEKK